MNLLVGFWVPERPASFRNVSDTRWWKQHLQESVASSKEFEEILLGSPLVMAPSQSSISLEVLHLHAGGPLRDVDNTAKPIMDAFNKRLYHDDKQVRELTFRSLQYDCGAAHSALQSNTLFSRFFGEAVRQANRGGHTIEHLTFVAFQDINASLNSSAIGTPPGALSWNQIRHAFS